MFDPQHLRTGEHSQLVNLAGLAREQYKEYLRREILVNNRIDLLATKVLGYSVETFHANMMHFQLRHPNNLQLAARGFGKSTICTVVKGIDYVIKFPKIRIVIGSKTIKQSQARLKEISSHLTSNEFLIELFGEFYNPALWNAREIEIKQRKDPRFKNSPGASANDATPTIACVGARGSIAGAHFDVELGDDFIDKTNSGTETVREEFNEWYNSTFSPMLDPADPDIPFRGHRHRVGTRYHIHDQYGRWIAQARDAHKAGVDPSQRMHINVIPAYDYRDTRSDPLVGLGLGVYSGRGTGRSAWPKRWTVQELAKRQRDYGRIAFEAQYLNDISAMNGEIFDYDSFLEIDEQEVAKLYSQMSFYIGCDFAISQRETADDSAFVVVGKVGRGDNAKYYIVDAVIGKMRFGDQSRAIKRLHDKWNKIGTGVKRIGLEVVQYQQAQVHHLEDTTDLKDKLFRIMPRKGDDKISRAHRRTPLVDGGRVFLLTRTIVVNGEETLETPGWQVRDQAVGMPSGEHDDAWDAFDHAVTASMRGKKVRPDEFGLL